MSALKFDGHIHQLELIDSKGATVGAWAAYNNIDHAFAKAHYGGLTHLMDGTYEIEDKAAPHAHKADPNGPYGSYGIIRFYYPDHSGVGVHSGRLHDKRTPGPRHATHGCIRTTDPAMLTIRNTMAKDPLTSITILHNTEESAKRGHAKHGHHI